MQNKSPEPAGSASFSGEVYLRLYASTSDSYSLVYAGLENSVESAKDTVRHKWSTLRHRYIWILYKIYTNGATIVEGRLKQDYNPNMPLPCE